MERKCSFTFLDNKGEFFLAVHFHLQIKRYLPTKRIRFFSILMFGLWKKTTSLNYPEYFIKMFQKKKKVQKKIHKKKRNNNII